MHCWLPGRWWIACVRCTANSNAVLARPLPCIARSRASLQSLAWPLRSLCERGWVERRRSATDQRSVKLHVTSAGRGILNATSGRVAGTLQRAVHSLDDRELGKLADSLHALLRHLPDVAPSAAAGEA